jgi:hypothetical protein
MQLKMTSTNRTILAVVIVITLSIAFWILVLGPKRDEADKVGLKVEKAESSLAQHQAEATEGQEARANFSDNYQQLVVLGKAVPGDDDSASLLVQLNQIGDRSKSKFVTFKMVPGELTPATPEASEAAAAEAAPASTTPVSPTEAAASTLPIGAAVGPAGFGVMPYTLTFQGNFFKIADFISGLDALVDTKNQNVAVDGRLITVDGFSLTARGDRPFPALNATFTVSTYVTPPAQGVTAGATPSAPAPTTAVPASTSIGGTP